MKQYPIVWTIAGNDPCCGAGIQADVSAIRALGGRPCAIAAALTAQSACRVYATQPVAPVFIERQIRALLDDAPPVAVKTGMLGGAPQVTAVARALEHIPAYVVCDPVILSSSGFPLLDEAGIECLKHDFFSRIDLLTPNLPECARLTGCAADSEEQFPELADALRAMGVKAVLIKGGHADTPESRDYYTDGTCSFWMHSPRCAGPNVHGTGCLLSAAAATGVALGYDPADAVTLAKTCVNQGLRTAVCTGAGAPCMAAHVRPEHPADFPWITDHAGFTRPTTSFPDCGPEPLGLYPLVESSDQVRRLITAGVSTIQLRLKKQTGGETDNEIRKAVAAAREPGCRLFINDYWEAAIRHGAYGVHLGQEDLKTADCTAIHAAGLRLGTSTHSLSELARALAWRPSYVAMGTVFPSPSKPTLSRHLGIDNLQKMIKLAGLPVVAIGGLHVENAEDVIRAGASGVAVISDIKNHPDVRRRVEEWNRLFKVCRPSGR